MQKKASKKDATAASMPLQSAAPTQAPTVSTAEALVSSVPDTITAIGASFVEECVAVVTANSELVEPNKSVMGRYEYEVLVLFPLEQAAQDVSF